MDQNDIAKMISEDVRDNSFSEAVIARTDPTKCTECGYTLNAHTSADQSDIIPEAGDVSVCLSCSKIMIYGNGLVLREPTSEEKVKLSNDETLQKVVAAIRR